MNRDEQEFEAWYDLPADQTLNDPKLYRQFLDDTLPDHTKTFCEKAWKAALAAERARSKCLVEALEKAKKDFAWQGLHKQSQACGKALKQYRDEFHTEKEVRNNMRDIRNSQ